MIMKRRFFILLLAALILFGADAHAKVVKPGKKGTDDAKSITRELKKSGRVKLVKGKKYHLRSNIRVGSNMTLNATGATLIVYHSAIRNDGGRLKKGYASMSNIRIVGGTWKSKKKKGNSGTAFSFSHARKITLKNMDIRCAHADGHGIELVGCKDVTVKNCKVIARGNGKKNSIEESIQIDMAEKYTAPFLKKRPRLWDGTPCRNIVIDGCTVTGCRGISSNYVKKTKKFLNQYHDNIVIKNCTVTGTKAEALALFNATNVTVKNNTLISKSRRVDEAYSIGCHMAIFGNKAVPAYAKGKNLVENNVIKGGRQGFQICSHTESVYGELLIRNNKIYCKNGIWDALHVAYNAGYTSSADMVDDSGNMLYEW